MAQKIEMGKQYRTRDGKEVVIYSVTSRADYQTIHGAVKLESGWDIDWWYADGKNSGDLAHDLIEVKPEKTVWVNIYEGNYHEGGSCYSLKQSRTEADSHVGTLKRVACLPITFREGDGLEV